MNLKRLFQFLALNCIFPGTPSASESSSCGELRVAQEKLLSHKSESWPKSCALVEKLYGEYLAGRLKFLEACYRNETLVGKALSREEKKRQKASWQSFLNPPSLDSFIDSSDTLGVECAPEGQLVLQYRKSAQTVIGDINKKLSEQ
jgi:hypothetical protein